MPRSPSQFIPQVLVCNQRICRRDGATEILNCLRQQDLATYHLSHCGCLGLCGSGPILLVISAPNQAWCYSHLRPSQVAAIADHHLHQQRPVLALNPRPYPP
ncbi:MAG: (2Fe-2S) ferredoxin domain-containing protein [Pseudanabaenaceae cyanobacterium bins.68]|nr:(2Fe-2S) ferredoxin domain-containing protein [Pseudanabaenaceae cyanobacterium bins.68]